MKKNVVIRELDQNGELLRAEVVTLEGEHIRIPADHPTALLLFEHIKRLGYQPFSQYFAYEEHNPKEPVFSMVPALFEDGSFKLVSTPGEVLPEDRVQSWVYELEDDDLFCSRDVDVEEWERQEEEELRKSLPKRKMTYEESKIFETLDFAEGQRYLREIGIYEDESDVLH